MTRPLRLEFPGALYHVTARGDRKVDIYLDDTDRLVWLQTLAEVCSQTDFVVFAFCLMRNHYHVLLETINGNLAKGMRQLNGVYSQYFNRRHKLVGHVFQGRYQALLVQDESYLLEVARYVVLNPVRAKLINMPGDWPWSSYCMKLGTVEPPNWLDTDSLLSRLASDRKEAHLAYQRFVLAGIGQHSPMIQARNRLLLGDGQFASQIQSNATERSLTGISRSQRSMLVPSLDTFQLQFSDHKEAIARAYASKAYSIAEIARHFNISPATVSRAIQSRNKTRS
jgi:REP element-mobilizing transposase RayT